MIFGGVNIQGVAGQERFDAGFVLQKLDTKQQFFFLSGLVEGLAYQRFLRDRPDESGMKCITNWLYSDTGKRWKSVRGVFEKHHDKPPAVLVYLLTKKECGA